MALTGRHILQAFADCQHPKADRVSLDSKGFPTSPGRGLLLCARCGAHKRGKDWMVAHLVSCAIMAANNMAEKATKS